MTDRLLPTWPTVAATPYPWPFDARWSAADSALLVVDVQQDLVSAVADDALLDTMEAVIDAARRSGLPVIFSLRTRPAGAAPMPEDLVAPDARVPVAGTPGAALARPPWRTPSDDLVERSAWSAFNGTDLADRLARRGIRNLILIGLTTDGAVHASMRKANDAGLECLLIEDACASVVPAHHQTILNVTRFGNGLFGTTAMAHQLLRALPES